MIVRLLFEQFVLCYIFLIWLWMKGDPSTYPLRDDIRPGVRNGKSAGNGLGPEVMETQLPVKNRMDCFNGFATILFFELADIFLLTSNSWAF